MSRTKGPVNMGRSDIALELRRLAAHLSAPQLPNLLGYEWEAFAAQCALASVHLDADQISLLSVVVGEATPPTLRVGEWANVPVPVGSLTTPTAGRPKGVACTNGGRHRYAIPAEGMSPECVNCGRLKGAAPTP